MQPLSPPSTSHPIIRKIQNLTIILKEPLFLPLPLPPPPPPRRNNHLLDLLLPLPPHKLILNAGRHSRDRVLVARVKSLRNGRRNAYSFYVLAEEPGRGVLDVEIGC